MSSLHAVLEIHNCLLTQGKERVTKIPAATMNSSCLWNFHVTLVSLMIGQFGTKWQEAVE